MLERQSIQSEAIALWAPAALGRLISCSFGGAEGIRTPDLRSAIAALSQLSYGPRRRHERADRVPAFGEFGPFRAEGLACQWPAQGEIRLIKKASNARG